MSKILIAFVLVALASVDVDATVTVDQDRGAEIALYKSCVALNINAEFFEAGATMLIENALSEGERPGELIKEVGEMVRIIFTDKLKGIVGYCNGEKS